MKSAHTTGIDATRSSNDGALLAPRTLGSIFASYVALSILITWPLLSDASAGVIGDDLDPLQTLWGFWWLRHWQEFSASPFVTPLLWWPSGVAVWLQTWDLPSALLILPLWNVLSEEWIYNLPLLMSFPASGLTMYVCARRIWGGSLGPFLAGCVYTFSTFHYAAAGANLHIASMQWPPLFLAALWGRAPTDNLRAAVAAGASLALATLTSLYYGVFCLTILAWLCTDSVWRRTLRARWVAWVVVTFLVCAGWYVVGVLVHASSGVYIGAHSPVAFSADLQSFLSYNGVNRWASTDGRWTSWVAARWSTGSFLGFAALSLAIASAIVSHNARRFLVLAGVGCVLALGPYLQVGGMVYADYLLPAGWLLRLVPGLSFGGIVSRFAWLTVFGVALAAGGALTWLVGRRRWGSLAGILLTAAGIVETLPASFQITPLDRPSAFQHLSRGGGPAILDATGEGWALWYQTLHRRPIVGGYVTRTPSPAADTLSRDSILSAFFLPPQVHRIDQDPSMPTGRLTQRRVHTVRHVPPVGPAAAVRHLREAGIGFVVARVGDDLVARRWGLREKSRGGTVILFEVP
jgi:hypothetical protein